MYQKIIQFIKYHNAFTIGISLVLVLSLSAMASEDVRNTVIGQEIVTEQGIDNSTILAADLDNFDFQLTIENIREDPQNYYVDYSYQLLAIQNNVWQPILRQQTLTVSKAALGGRDLGRYAAEELGEVIDYELSYLKEVQELEDKKGQTQIVQTTTYIGLIGLVLNPETKVLPGYEPVVKPPEIIVQSEPVSVCQPNWICSDWSPDVASVVLGQEFVQTRVCQDVNNCGISDGRPAEQQTAFGTFQSEQVTSLTPPTPVCDSEHLDLCTTQELCERASLYWYSETCNTEPEVLTCTPNWSCTDWQPLPETIACEETFTQTRTCTDSNNCGTEEGKPIEEQKAIGNDSSTCGTTPCDPDGTLYLVGDCQNTCVEGTCQNCTPTCSCAEGWADCNNDLIDGCEFQLETSTSTCP